MRMLSAIVLSLPSCTVINGNSMTGRYTYASIGGNVTGLEQTAEGIKAGGIDNEAGFRELNKTARGSILSNAAVDLAKTAASVIPP